MDGFPTLIQHLFAVKPPLAFIPPGDYPMGVRRTPVITGVALMKSQYQAHVDDLNKVALPVVPNHQKEKATDKKELFVRQLNEWPTPAFNDPMRTVFVARLDYNVTELELVDEFKKFGPVESAVVIRDRNGASRGYGFVVYGRETDAGECVETLLRSGVRIRDRMLLVDFQRNHTMRQWKPMRLGGGLGGRGSKGTASAAVTRKRPQPSYLLRTFQSRPRSRDPRDHKRSVRDKYASYLTMKY